MTQPAEGERSARASRAARGLLASALAIHVAAFFHVAGGGTAPAPVAVALTLALAAPPSIALAGRRMSALRVSATVGFSQLLFHLLFTLSPAAMPGSGAGGHDHGSLSGMPVVIPAVPPMWQAHALAAIVTAAALLAGARAIGAARRAGHSVLARLLGALYSPEPVVRLGGRLPEPPTAALTDRLDLLLQLRHRGPPGSTALFS